MGRSRLSLASQTLVPNSKAAVPMAVIIQYNVSIL
jgi:hypothetical protein